MLFRSALQHPTAIPGLVTNALKQAYIQPEKVDISYKHKFDIHTSYFDIVVEYLSSIRSSDDFWYQLVINGFQSTISHDNDPDAVFIPEEGPVTVMTPESSYAGASAVGFIDANWNVAFLFIETIRDVNVVNSFNSVQLWDYALLFAHEIGHNGRDDNSHIEDGIMNSEGLSAIGGKPMNYYDIDTILKFRKQTVW